MTIKLFFILECVFDRNNVFGESMDMLSSELEVFVTNPQILLVAAGRVVWGTRIKSWYESNEHYHKRVYHAIYVYEINGKTYKRGAHSHFTELPGLVQFYYINTPKKALCEYDNVDVVVQLMVPVLFILPIAVTWVFMKGFGIDLGALN